MIVVVLELFVHRKVIVVLVQLVLNDRTLNFIVLELDHRNHRTLMVVVVLILMSQTVEKLAIGYSLMNSIESIQATCFT
jgi:hypothetical protein